MKLRNITIWATGLMLVLTNIMVFVYFFLRGAHYSNFSPIMTAISCLPTCLICTSPLLVSGIVLLFLKHPISLIMLLLAMIFYSVGVFWALCDTWGAYECMSGIQFFGLAFGSFCYMVPVWVITLLLNSYCTRKMTSDPATSPCETPYSNNNNHEE